MIEAPYPEVIASSLYKIFPELFLLPNSKEHRGLFESKLPFFQWSFQEGTLFLYFVCRHRLNISKFFYEIIHRWLLPGRRVNETFFFSSNFKWPEVGPHLYCLAEMMVRVDQEKDFKQVEHNLRIIETEIRLGMVSVYHASRLLEAHFLTTQKKHGIIQEKISQLLQRYPEEIDYDIFGELQYFIVMSKEEFKILRSPHHLSRLVILFYLFRKSIEKERGRLVERRHIRLKLAEVELDLPWGMKKVLGICIGLNLLRPNELFEERHFVRALQNGMPGITAVADSFFVNEGTGDGIQTLYLEIEKENQASFTREEMSHLRVFLPEELKRVVEVPLNSLFMPRNEEEILRHMVTLAGELRFVKDPPQLILTFDEQREQSLYFTLILARLVLSDTLSIQSLIEKEDSSLNYIPDRVKRVGMLRKRYPKEVTVFRVKLSSGPFLRDDHSVDLFKARQSIVQELKKIMGEVRDYMGGMIAKQVELLDSLRRLIGIENRANQRLLESLFHTIYPIEARSVLSPQQINRMFLLWKILLQDTTQKRVVEQEGNVLHVMGRSSAIPEIDPSSFAEMQMIIFRPEQDEQFLGYLFFFQDLKEKENFLSFFSSEDVVTIS